MSILVKAADTLFESGLPAQPVNVASVPQRSPFRYPGGKTWLIPQIRKWLKSCGPLKHFYEPFLGGGSVSLSVAFERLAERAIMAERDEEVAAVWKVMLSDENERLARLIEGFHMNPHSLESLLSRPPDTLVDIAFATLVKNRTFHGGILAPGSGKMKHGENGKGLHSRWYPETLARRVRAIATVRDRLYFIEGDGLDLISSDQAVPESAFFVDPPYTVAGKRAGSRLYRHSVIDHEALFALCARVRGSLLMTYDNCAEVAGLAHAQYLECKAIPMKNTHNATMTELLIGKDLAWAG
jgi:DNA adenine methylase